MNKRQKKKKMKSLRTKYSAEAYKTMYDAIYKKWQEAEANVDALKVLVASRDQVIIRQAVMLSNYRSFYGMDGRTFRIKEEKDDI